MVAVVLGYKGDLDSDISIKGVKNDEECCNPSICPVNSENIEKGFGSGFENSQRISGHTYSPIEKPTMRELPEIISLPQTVRIPTQIKGFKPLVPRK